jgi:hypothetical protein
VPNNRCLARLVSQNEAMKNFLLRLAAIVAAVVLVFNSQTAKAADEMSATNLSALRLAAIFGDNMVLQQQQTIPVWGWAAPDADVTVKFAGQTKSTRAGADGKWLVKLGKLKASSEPQNLVVESGGTKTFTNILVGEVWLASGQSNMEKPIGIQRGQRPVFNAERELAAANYPDIRIFQVGKKLSATPLETFIQISMCRWAWLNRHGAARASSRGRRRPGLSKSLRRRNSRRQNSPRTGSPTRVRWRFTTR